MTAYYNEFDPYAAQWLRNLIAAGHIAPGDVDERSITDVAPNDLAGYRQCHFFAGIAGWSLAARLAGWPDDRELWTGSAPCQPFSVAGAQRGTDDERHLWPHLFRLTSARRPAVLMGEQVAAAVGKDWLDGVCADLEGVGYACGAAVVPACAVDGPHRRDRLWFVGEHRGRTLAHSAGERCDGRQRESSQDGRELRVTDACTGGSCGGGDVADGDGLRRQINPDPGRRASGSVAGEVTGPCGACDGDVADGQEQRSPHRDAGAISGYAVAQRQAVESQRCSGSAWAGSGWIIGHDGKARRVEPSIRLLAHGVPARVGRLRAYGNAIVPQVAAEVIAAYMECRP